MAECLVRKIDLFSRVGLVAHSAAALVAVKAVRLEPDLYSGLFSIEGNLTEADAYFSGQAAAYDSAQAFKDALLDGLWATGDRSKIMRRYYAAASMSHCETMWRFGRDVKARSVGAAGDFATLPIPALYYWSRDNVPELSRAVVESERFLTRQFCEGSHWPSVDAPLQTGEAIGEFFDRAFRDE